jgi:hypothetical protein
MKKLLLVLAIAGFAVACNNGSEKKETTDSTTTMSPDTTSKMAPDTTMMNDTTKKDTTKM